MELPADLMNVFVERGQILHSDIFENIDHPKFFVIVGVTDDEVAGFYMNEILEKVRTSKLFSKITKDKFFYS